MKLDGFDFSNGIIIESTFSQCSLKKSNFSHCKLDNTEFFSCDISEGDFREASGYKIDVSGNKMKGAKFTFPEVCNLLTGLGIKIE